MKLFELFATISLDDKNFTDGVKRSTAAGKQLGSSMDGVSIKAVALGTALYNAGVQAAKMAGSLVKTSIEAAATMQAETAQFNSAFGEMAGVATKALKNVEGETGILYTRLRTVGTKAFSQLKGAGLETADAMGAMEEYTKLAADAAAYYDISLEEADAKLRSFMRGNTEAGDAIGLFTSEAQRNERAVEKYGKKWLELGEAQKQMLMLDITRSIYEQSGALGQAAEEADSWSNIMGNVGSAWTTLLAKFGAPVMEAVKTPIQNAINTMTSEETQQKMEQVGIWLANGITKLYDGEDSPIQQTIKFVGDVADAFTSDTGQSVLKAAGIAGGAILAITNPVAAVAAGVLAIVTNWDKVKRAASDAGRQIVMLFTGKGSQPTTEDYESWAGMSAVERAAAVMSGEIPQNTAKLFEAYESDPNQPDPMRAFSSFAPEQTNDTSMWQAMGLDEEELAKMGITGNAKGLPYVPYDNYLTLLHRGEQVVQANRATQNRTGGMDGSGLYGAIVAAVREGVSNIAVNMDGKKVGTLVTRHQSAQIDNDIRAGRYSFA